jgi:hypothetical protein
MVVPKIDVDFKIFIGLIVILKVISILRGLKEDMNPSYRITL